MNYLSVNGIAAGYGKQNIIENISFQLKDGTIVLAITLPFKTVKPLEL